MAVSVSLITVCFNAAQTIERCIQSVLRQSYPHLQYIVIDGASTDGSINIIKRYEEQISLFHSGKDNGPYDAMNKGLALATGDVVGFLHADDQLADAETLSRIASVFASRPETDAVYGDLNFYDAQGKCVRRWQSSVFTPEKMRFGWMPAHPTFYMKQGLYEDEGGFFDGFGSAADYELMLRYLHTRKIAAQYLPGEMVKMQTGGISN
ncbi:MAG: glycosyltransferase, partial [Mucilaginibacter polytrichastri]|nr:glycosyltransferase [Mucilaginibacter polytrichastri]